MSDEGVGETSIQLIISTWFCMSHIDGAVDDGPQGTSTNVSLQDELLFEIREARRTCEFWEIHPSVLERWRR